MDEGWTRWILEQYRFAPTSLYNADIKKGGLQSKFDTIVIPDLRDRDMLLNGLTSLDVPEQYAGGISDEGSIALKKFVSEGGTLVALNSASDAIIDLFALPVTNVVKNADADKFFCSGALLQVSLGQPSRATAGMAADPVVMFWRGPVFEPKRGFRGECAGVVCANRQSAAQRCAAASRSDPGQGGRTGSGIRQGARFSVRLPTAVAGAVAWGVQAFIQFAVCVWGQEGSATSVGDDRRSRTDLESAQKSEALNRRAART